MSAGDLRAPLGSAKVRHAMAHKDDEQLDVEEMERMVARAVIDLLDAPGAQPVTFRDLVRRTGLPKHRVREVVEEWQLRTLSGDEYLFTPESLEPIRKRAAERRR